MTGTTTEVEIPRKPSLEEHRERVLRTRYEFHAAHSAFQLALRAWGESKTPETTAAMVAARQAWIEARRVAQEAEVASRAAWNEHRQALRAKEGW